MALRFASSSLRELSGANFSANSFKCFFESFAIESDKLKNLKYFAVLYLKKPVANRRSCPLNVIVRCARVFHSRHTPDIYIHHPILTFCFINFNIYYKYRFRQQYFELVLFTFFIFFKSYAPAVGRPLVLLVWIHHVGEVVGRCRAGWTHRGTDFCARERVKG